MKLVPPIVGWGVGWSTGLVLMIALLTARQSGLSWIHYPMLPVVGIAAFGFPVYRGARQNGSRNALAEASIWVLGFTVAAILLIDHAGASERLASPGDLNIVTSEGMRQREWYFRTFGLSPEAVLEAVFVFTVVAAFLIGCGFLSGMTATWSRRGMRGAGHALVFGVATAAAVLTGALLLVMGGPLVAHVMSIGATGARETLAIVLGIVASGLAAGGIVGAIVESARQGLLNRHGPRE